MCAAWSGPSWACSRRGRRTWAWPPTTSSSRFATPSGPATRRARASTRCSTRSSSRWRRPCARSAWSSGPWSSSRPTMRWPPRPHGGGRPARRPGAGVHAGQGPGAVRAGRRVVQLDRARARCATKRGCAGSSASRRLDPRLARARRGQRRRLPGSARLGEGVRRDGARPVSAPRARSRCTPRSGTFGARRGRLATTLAEQRDRARLFRELATLRLDAPIGTDVDALRWTGPRADFAAWAERLGTPALHERAVALAAARRAVVR